MVLSFFAFLFSGPEEPLYTTLGPVGGGPGAPWYIVLPTILVGVLGYALFVWPSKPRKRSRREVGR
jgi:hypothetical protein